MIVPVFAIRPFDAVLLPSPSLIFQHKFKRIMPPNSRTEGFRFFPGPAKQPKLPALSLLVNDNTTYGFVCD